MDQQEGQQQQQPQEGQQWPGQPFSHVTLEGLRGMLAEFARERDWEQFHTPRNLLLALVGEVGELSEIFQWRGEVAPGLPGFSQKDRTHVGEELSDCLLYLIRLADVCGIDLASAAMSKIEANAAKYPADQCKGSAAKYTELREAARKAAASEARQAAEGEQEGGSGPSN